MPNTVQRRDELIEAAKDLASPPISIKPEEIDYFTRLLTNIIQWPPTGPTLGGPFHPPPPNPTPYP